MQQIIIHVNPTIYKHIMFFLQNLPKNLVDIQPQTSVPNKPSKRAFGLLKGKIKDPVAWQRKIREENDSTIYESFE